jgi:hypothetical protein
MDHALINTMIEAFPIVRVIPSLKVGNVQYRS